jgi:hypothetical protein
VQGAFLVLADSNRLHLVTGSHRTNANDGFPQFEFYSGDDTWSLLGDTDRSTWTSLLQEIITNKASKQDLANQEVFCIPALGQDPRTSELSTVSAPVKVSFFAGVLLTSKSGHNIGALCVVDTVERSHLAKPEVEFLTTTARRCMSLLGLARERGFRSRWTAMQEELDTFLKSRAIHAQLLEEPKTPAGLKPSREEEDGGKAKENGADWTDPKALLKEPFAGVGTTPVKGPESERLVEEEVKREHHFTARENQPNVHSSTAKRGKDETTYRKVFRRAARCLHSALKADGVLFIDGLIGYHGDVQPAAESEAELQSEIVGPSDHCDESASADPTSDRPNNSDGPHDPHSRYPPSTHSRIYTSAEYMKGVYVKTPAEVLGYSGASEVLEFIRISESTLGLPNLDEGFLQRLMDRHPGGAVWQLTNSSFMQVQNETLVEVDLKEEERRLTATFKDIRQLIFKPLTDPTSLKRLGACFAWRMKPIPVFTDVVDLSSMKSFIHVVESELARHDASHVAKQKETFVSSVSHELSMCP